MDRTQSGAGAPSSVDHRSVGVLLGCAAEEAVHRCEQIGVEHQEQQVRQGSQQDRAEVASDASAGLAVKGRRDRPGRACDRYQRDAAATFARRRRPTPMAKPVPAESVTEHGLSPATVRGREKPREGSTAAPVAIWQRARDFLGDGNGVSARRLTREAWVKGYLHGDEALPSRQPLAERVAQPDIGPITWGSCNKKSGGREGKLPIHRQLALC
jgi:hypothetical protein